MTDLTVSGLSKVLSTDLALLKNFLEFQKAAGFNEASRIIEILARELFTAAGYGNFKDANLKRFNQEAIDLYDDKARVAVQVTSNAGAVKLRKTIAAFEKRDAQGKSLLDDYDELYIWGVNSAQKKWAGCPSYCKILDSEDLLNKLTSDADIEAISTAVNAIRKHQDLFLALTPYSDIECLKIVLGVMNRSALKHTMSCEGSVDGMKNGLAMVSEVIGQGTLKGKSVSKPLFSYSEPLIKAFLKEVLDGISEIDALINSATYQDFCCLDFYQNSKVNDLKRALIDLVNKISQEFNLDVVMRMI